MKITEAFNQAIADNLLGTSTILDINYVAFLSSRYDLNSLDNLGTIPTEIDRIAISLSDMSYVNKRFIFDFSIDADKCVCPTATISAKDSTSTIITVDSASSFDVNNLIEVETDTGFIETGILAKNVNDITIISPINAKITGKIRKKVSHLAFLCNATSFINSSDLIFTFINKVFYKDSTAVFPIKRSFEFFSS